MSEMIWRFDVPRLDEESLVQPILEAIARFPGFEAVEYDLNQREQWRAFDLGRIVVDALTQRTQIVRVRGPGSDTVAMVALGKHDEQPTSIVRMPGGPSVERVVAHWETLFEALPMASALLTHSAWRTELSRTGLQGEALAGMVQAWKRGREPRGLTQIPDELSPESVIGIILEPSYVGLQLARGPEIVDDAHARDLERVARLLRRS